LAKRAGEIMKIICTELFEEQLKEILIRMIDTDYKASKGFKSYLDTIIVNIPTKSKKYKKSIFFDDENVKDIEHQGFIIPFYIDKANNSYLVLGILQK
jgi:hypothetical protein